MASLLLVRYILSLEDHLAWYDYYDDNLSGFGWSSLPILGRTISARRRTRFSQGILSATNQSAIGERTIELLPSGVREFSSEFDFSTDWKEITHAAVTPQHLFIAHWSMNAHIIPLRYFEGGQLRDSFIAFVVNHIPSTVDRRNG